MTNEFSFSGFGWRPLRTWIAALLYAFGGFAVYLMFEKFDPILKVGVPVYGLILLTMAWRAISRIQSASNLPKILCAIGAILFVASDSLIAFSMFYSPIKYSKVLISKLTNFLSLKKFYNQFQHQCRRTTLGNSASRYQSSIPR